MSFVEIPKTRLIQHFMCLDVSKFHAVRFSNQIAMWSRKSGKAWTVRRLKSLQQAHKNALISGAYPSIPEGWGRRKNSKGQWIYKDTLIHGMMKKTNNSRELELQLVFFRMHEVIKLSATSEEQFSKWIDGVIKPYDSPKTVKACVEGIGVFIKNMSLPDPQTGWGDFVSLVHQPERNKSSPICTRSGLKTKTRTHIEVFTLEPLRNPEWFNLVLEYPSCVAACLTGNGDQDTIVNRIREFGPTTSHVGGVIGFIQEKSVKLRAVASPYLVLQAMGEPAKRMLGELTKIIPEMHTHSQDAAKQQVSDALALGQKVHGYDATAFTDRLPFGLQDLVLTKLVDKGWLSEFDQASIHAMIKSDWAIHGLEKIKFQVNTVSWKVGQPMGYGPSFHLAALTHYIILRYCAAKVKVQWQNKFAVVGDDVTIFDDKIADEYYVTMTELGVEINLEKSVSSSEIGEFCKKVILPDAVLSSITVQDNLVTDSSIVLAAEFYGKRILKCLSKKQLLLSDPIMLPINMGGLNWSPKNTKYKDYLNDILRVDNISAYTLSKSLFDFYDFDKSGNLEFMLNTLASRYDYWDKPVAYACTTSELAFYMDANVTVSDWTGLPANIQTSYYCASTSNRTYDRSTSPNFSEIVDKSLMMHLASQSLIHPEFIKRHFSWAFDKYGFSILNVEKAPRRPITLWSIVNNDPNDKETSKQYLGRIRKFLKGRVANYQW